MHFDFKTLIIGVLTIVCLGGATYKVYEYGTVKNFVTTLDSNVREELVLMSEEDELGDDLYDTITEKFGDGTEKERKKVETKDFDTVIRQIKLAKEKHQEYQEEIEKNQKELSAFEAKGKYLIGAKKAFYTGLINTLKEYYKTEVPASAASGVHTDMLISYFELTHDASLLGKDDLLRRKDPSATAAEFQNVAPLEKYTKSDFKYLSDEEIKSMFPYGYDVLNRYREFLKSYYLIVKDLVNRDYEAAAYKYEKFSKDATNLTFDWKKFVSENKDENLEKYKVIAEKIVERFDAQSAFNSKAFGKYPLAKEFSFNSADVLSCEVLLIKESIYFGKIEKTPSTNSLDDFISDINKVSPKTDSVFDRLNKDAFALENKDKKAILTCKDKTANKEYKFTFVKKTD